MPGASSEFQRPATVAEDVYRHLRSQLLSGAWPGGSWLREQELAATLAVSRTPVREAIRQLAQEGLVKVEANRGVRVHEPSLAEAVASYEVREQLEGMAARLAAARIDATAESVLRERLASMLAIPAADFAGHIEADNAFHLSIASLSGNPILQELVERLTTRVNRVKVLTRHVNSTPLAHAQHEAIAKAIITGDSDLAEKRMAEHIRENLRIVSERLGSPATNTVPASATASATAPAEQTGEGAA